jgi:hypothetical protein
VRVSAIFANQFCLGIFEGRNDFIYQLAKDIQAEFPGIKGFSRRNLFNIRKFYSFYSSDSVQQVVALKTEDDLGQKVQQLVGLNEKEEISVQQAVALNEKTPKVCPKNWKRKFRPSRNLKRN